jgi:hypothetical protein
VSYELRGSPPPRLGEQKAALDLPHSEKGIFAAKWKINLMEEKGRSIPRQAGEIVADRLHFPYLFWCARPSAEGAHLLFLERLSHLLARAAA